MGSQAPGDQAPLRIAIGAGVRLYREGLSLAIRTRTPHDVVGLAGSWSDLSVLVRESFPDVVLVDVRLPGQPAPLRELVCDVPMSRFVALSVDDHEAHLVPWAEAGISGWVTREEPLEVLLDAVASVARGEFTCSPRMSVALMRRLATLAMGQASPRPAARLTPRERQIVDLIERGWTNKEIGRHLSIELPTVKNHVHNILAKLEVRGRAQAVARLRAWSGTSQASGVPRAETGP